MTEVAGICLPVYILQDTNVANNYYTNLKSKNPVKCQVKS